ncbi:site-specific DNA-methyltransferase [Paraburkholderia sp. MM6662-R1]|uniref:site-specific DNA-methyltransferase n=1 Tax=Paraburkholderia sp. MM6662-R1 TaxID=2991066 RepID=UPI003D1BE467
MSKAKAAPAALAPDAPTIMMPTALVMRRLEELVPYAQNARTHSDEQVAQIAASMREFGFTNPILTADDGILAGHGRLLAAMSLSLQVVPTIDLSHLSQVQRRAYVLSDNKIAINAGWDLDILRMELGELDEAGFDLSITGFGAEELDELLAPQMPGDGPDPDEVPEPPVVPFSKPGDVWILGPHRVLCGDALAVTDWETLMEGERADIVWTDPPYNVDYSSKAGKIKNDNMADKAFHDFLAGAFGGLYTVMKAGAAIYVAHADTEGYNVRSAFRAAGFRLSGCIIWRKNSLVLGRSPYQWIHEPILYGWRPGAAHRWFGGRKQTTVMDLGEASPFQQQDDGRWVVQAGDQLLVVSGEAMVENLEPSVISYDRPSRSALHPTTKPVGLIVRMLRNSARPNDIVVDAFGGSGSTLIGAEMAGMCARVMELDAKFVDVICKRYFGFTGRRAVHAETGEPFPDSDPVEVSA